MAFQETTFGCFDDWFSCCIAFSMQAPCMTAELVRKTTGEGFCVPMLLHKFLCCIGGAMNRGKIRVKYGLEGSFMNDLLCMCFCEPCTTAQLWREVARRG